MILPLTAAAVLYAVTGPAAARRLWRRRRWRTTGRAARWWWRLLGLVALVALGLLLLLAPRWLVAHDSAIVELTDEQYRQAIRDARTAVLQAVGGLLLAAGAVATWRQVRISREGQITERFTRAVDQVGDEQPDIRLGGIYALERIGRDSLPDRTTVAEVLSAFVREHAPWPPRTAAGQPPEQPPETAGSLPPPLMVRLPDVHAAVNALSRLHLEVVPRFDLSWCDLRRVTVDGSLRAANLMHANLQFAKLIGTDLGTAWLNEADLREAVLQGADLRGAALADADLRKANLRNADLRQAVLSSADLREAVLAGADLRETILQTVKLQEAIMDTRTRWPDGFDPVAAGVTLASH